MTDDVIFVGPVAKKLRVDPECACRTGPKLAGEEETGAGKLMLSAITKCG